MENKIVNDYVEELVEISALCNDCKGICEECKKKIRRDHIQEELDLLYDKQTRR